MILLMIGGIAMPSSLISYEFRYENLGCLILSESEIVRDALRIVEPPPVIVIDPLIRVCCVETYDFLCKRD